MTDPTPPEAAKPVDLEELAAKLEAVTAERDLLASICQQEHGVHHSWVDAANKGAKAQRDLAELLGMVHEPSMGPTWPASWPELIDGVRRLQAENTRLESALDHAMERIGNMT